MEGDNKTHVCCFPPRKQILTAIISPTFKSYMGQDRHLHTYMEGLEKIMKLIWVALNIARVENTWTRRRKIIKHVLQATHNRTQGRMILPVSLEMRVWKKT